MIAAHSKDSSTISNNRRQRNLQTSH